MITWIRENAALASVLAGFIAIISGGAVAYHQLSNLIAKQPGIDQHVYDTTRHIDPIRDPQAWKKLEERIEKLEEQQRQSRRGNWRRDRREAR
jgi:hypothetical protein